MSCEIRDATRAKVLDWEQRAARYGPPSRGEDAETVAGVRAVIKEMEDCPPLFALFVTWHEMLANVNAWAERVHPGDPRYHNTVDLTNWHAAARHTIARYQDQYHLTDATVEYLYSAVDGLHRYLSERPGVYANLALLSALY